MMASGKSVLIVGGGIIGLCIAHYAHEKGHRVQVVERGAPDRDCCSLGNAGLIVPSHIIPLAAPGMVGMGLKMLPDPESPFGMNLKWNPALLRWAWKFMRSGTEAHVARSASLIRDLNIASRQCYQEFAETRGNDFGLVRKGLLMLCKSQEALQSEKHLAEMARGLGMPAEILTAQETAQLEPHIDMEIAGSIYFPEDAHLTPPKFFFGLQQELEAKGVVFHWNTHATGWIKQHEQVEALRTSKGNFSADEYVVAGGSWSSELLTPLGCELPLMAGKGYSLTLPNPRQLPHIPSLLIEARVAVTPMGSTLRFAGTMELGEPNSTINQARVQGILKSIPRYLPAFSPHDFQNVPVWSGMRPCSPDGLPYIGRLKSYRNLSVATGHAMMGLSLGPITGKLMAQLLSEETPEISIDLLTPERFA